MPLRPSAKKELNAANPLPQLHFLHQETFALNFPDCGHSGSRVKLQYRAVIFAESWQNSVGLVESKGGRKDQEYVVTVCGSDGGIPGGCDGGDGGDGQGQTG